MARSEFRDVRAQHWDPPKAKALELFEKHGVSIDMLAERFGVERGTISVWLKRAREERKRGDERSTGRTD